MTWTYDIKSIKLCYILIDSVYELSSLYKTIFRVKDFTLSWKNYWNEKEKTNSYDLYIFFFFLGKKKIFFFLSYSILVD